MKRWIMYRGLLVPRTLRLIDDGWHYHHTGLLVPSSLSTVSTSSYADITRRASELEALYVRHDVAINPSCELARFIQNAKELGPRWIAKEPISQGMLFNAVRCDNVALELLPVADQLDCRVWLPKFTRETLDNTTRTPSRAKDALWELTIFALLRNCGVVARVDEPDVIAELPDGELVFACKKLYSAANISKVASKAVKQIERSGKPGVIAVSAADLLPPQPFLTCASEKELGEILRRLNSTFYSEYRSAFQQYFRSDRIVGVLLLTAVDALIRTGAGNRYLPARQLTLLNSSESLDAHARLIRHLQTAIGRVSY